MVVSGMSLATQQLLGCTFTVCGPRHINLCASGVFMHSPAANISKIVFDCCNCLLIQEDMHLRQDVVGIQNRWKHHSCSR